MNLKNRKTENNQKSQKHLKKNQEKSLEKNRKKIEV